MNMITGFIEPTSGRIIIDGHDISKKPKKAKKQIGYMPEGVPLYSDLTVKEFVTYMAELKGVPRKEKNALFNELYKTLDDALKLNVNDMLEAALTATRIEMSPSAKRQFFEKHIRPMRLGIDEAGNASLELRRK